MSESLWGEDDLPQAKTTRKHKPRTAVAPPVVQVEQAKPAFTNRETPRDFAFEDAIRALAPILHPDELPQFESILNPLSDPALRAEVEDWRRRNGMDEQS